MSEENKIEEYKKMENNRFWTNNFPCPRCGYCPCCERGWYNHASPYWNSIYPSFHNTTTTLPRG